MLNEKKLRASKYPQSHWFHCTWQCWCVCVNFQSSRCLKPAARNLKEIRVVRRSLSALAVIPYLFVVNPSEGGSGILFVQNMLGGKGQRVSWEGWWVQILPSGAADEAQAVASCLLLPLGLGQLYLLFLHCCAGVVSQVDLPTGQQLCFMTASKYFTGTMWKDRIVPDFLA